MRPFCHTVSSPTVSTRGRNLAVYRSLPGDRTSAFLLSAVVGLLAGGWFLVAGGVQPCRRWLASCSGRQTVVLPRLRGLEAERRHEFGRVRSGEVPYASQQRATVFLLLAYAA